MPRSMLLSFALMLAGIACLAAFNMIGSHIDADGHLREPLALLLTGSALLFMGIAAAAIARLRNFTSGRR